MKKKRPLKYKVGDKVQIITISKESAWYDDKDIKNHVLTLTHIEPTPSRIGYYIKCTDQEWVSSRNNLYDNIAVYGCRLKLIERGTE